MAAGVDEVGSKSQRLVGPKKQREGKISWTSEEGSWTGLHRLLDSTTGMVSTRDIRGGRKAGPLRRGDSGYWRGFGGRSALVHSVCAVMMGETWTSGLRSKPGL